MSSGEQLAGGQVSLPEGCPQGPALCLPCWLEVVEGKGPWQAQGSHSPSWAPLPRSRGALPHACLGASACPFLPSQLSAAGRAPELGAGLRAQGCCALTWLLRVRELPLPSIHHLRRQ